MYNHAPESYRCPFCLIAQGLADDTLYSAGQDIVYQNQAVTAFIGSHQWPNNPGNTIVIPNQHYENIYDLPASQAAHMHTLAQAVALAMKAAFDCDGISTRQHNEPAGNQEVWHFHLHVTPRYRGDRFYETIAGSRTLMPPAERARYAHRLRSALKLLA